VTASPTARPGLVAHEGRLSAALRNFAAYLTQTAGSDRLQPCATGHRKIARMTC
jgi:hypothetical protein